MFYFAGLAFWKCGSRKIYAVRVISNTRAPLKRSAKSKAKANCISYYDISDNSDEEFTPKRSRGVNHGDIQMVNSQISEVKSMVCDILKVNQTTLLGCEECVNAWFDGADGLSKKCPHCNEPRGYASTFQFKSIDEFLVGVRGLIKCDENNSSN